MKKIALFLTFILIFSFQTAYATTGTHNITGPATAKSGDTITVTVALASNYQIEGYGESEGLMYTSGVITFDETKVTYVDFTEICPQQAAAGNTGLGVASNFTFALGPTTPSKVTQLISVKFKIKDNVANNTNLTFTVGPTATRIWKENDPDKQYEDMTVTGSTLTVKVENPVVEPPAKSTNNNLKDLSITNYKLDKLFITKITDYTAIIPYSVNEVTVKTTLEDTKATVAITGNKNLKVGTNTVIVTVTSESGAKKEYKIIITKEEASDNNFLKSLTIEHLKLKEQFKKDKLTYTITIPNEIEAINVLVEEEHSKATTTIEGNMSLKVGKNTVKIIVTAENKEEKTYEIEVTRLEAVKKEEPKKEEKEEVVAPKKKGNDSMIGTILLGSGFAITLGTTITYGVLKKKNKI